MVNVAMATILSHLEGVNPPIPSTSSSEGSRLLTVIRLLEQEHSILLLTECVEILQQLVSSCQRKGLLIENVDLADQVLNSTTSASTNRKRGRHTSHSNVVESTEASSNATTTTSLDVNLILQGLVRILSMPASIPANDRYLLVVLVGDFCTFASEYLQSRSSKTSRFYLAEYQLLSSHPLVTSFQSCLQRFFATLQPSTNGLYTIDNDELTAAIVSSLRAVSSMIRLLGARLSRTPLDDLSTIAWKALAVADDPDATLAASILLSTLPMQRTNIAESWLQTWHETTSAMQMALGSIAPIVELSPPHGSVVLVPPPVQLWIQAIQREPLERERIESFLSLMTGLLQVLRCLLGENHPYLPSTLFVDLNVAPILDLIETIISFGSSAEAVYFGTKKRLRAEIVGGGALSAKVLAQVANAIKVIGLDLFCSFVQAVGGPSLLPFSDRLYKIASVAVRTSCSTSLRTVIDPGTAVDTKNQRWLHSSIPARTRAIRSFELCLIAFDTQVSGASSGGGHRSTSKDFDGSLNLIAGTLVEQLLNSNVPEATDWGSHLERSQLVEACANCLEACLVSSGEFLLESTRLVVDSVIHTCLRALVEGDNAVANTSALHKALLSLATAGVTTCWSNGASSSLSIALEEAARFCQRDRDTDVVLSASCALSACAMLSTARVPAINVVKGATKNERDDFASRILTPEALLERLEIARIEAIQRASGASMALESNKGAKTSIDVANNPPKALVASLPVFVEKKGPEVVPQVTSTKSLQKETNDSTTSGALRAVLDTARSSVMDSEEKETEDDDDFPMIVDADPDEEDVE